MDTDIISDCFQQIQTSSTVIRSVILWNLQFMIANIKIKVITDETIDLPSKLH
jgi:hypothetical protein